jgi:tetratricopeptide (TPR) repeat protein
MTERERYRTRGIFFTVTGDYDACVKEYTDLIARYASDAAAHNNLALCSTYLRDLDAAVEGMRHVVQLFPTRALYRVNLALYAGYKGDFETGVGEALAARELGSPLGLLPEAFSYLGQGRLKEAAAAYEALGKTGTAGASYAASGLGDLAVFEGRYGDAAGILSRGAEADLAAKDTDRAAAKFAAVAHAELLRGRNAMAIAAADRALASSQTVKVRFLAARVFASAGDPARARAVAATLAADMRHEPRAYARLIDGLIALGAGDARLAIPAFTEANALLDTWIGHVDLGRAYLAAGSYTQADSEFDRAMARKGEALALFLDEEPTYGFLPAVYYFQGRVREALNSAGFAEPYRTYLTLRAGAAEDPLINEIRRRAGG